MKATWWVAWSLVGSSVFLQGAAMASVQQEEAPILKPKQRTAATLLVMCDLACNWKLDGEAKGTIAGGEVKKVPVSLGQHLVDMTTQDGLDKVEEEIDIKTSGQTIVRIELQPVLTARLKAEQEQAAQEEVAGVTWSDPTTGLTWTKKVNDSPLNWQQAFNYCKNLQLAGHIDWRLPAIEELQGIYDLGSKSSCYSNSDSCYIKGNIQTDSSVWSSDKTLGDEAWTFRFDGGRWSGDDIVLGHRVLCVRRFRR
jgi:hypothetical protein